MPLVVKDCTFVLFIEERKRKKNFFCFHVHISHIFVKRDYWHQRRSTLIWDQKTKMDLKLWLLIFCFGVFTQLTLTKPFRPTSGTGVVDSKGEKNFTFSILILQIYYPIGHIHKIIYYWFFVRTLRKKRM